MARVLIVDDEENQLRALDVGLRLEGFDIATAREADLALDVLRREPVELAIVDLMMPGINGIELARKIRDLFPDTRVILTSAYHLSESQLTRADCGVVGFVPKPYVLAELAAFLRAKMACIAAGRDKERAALLAERAQDKSGSHSIAAAHEEGLEITGAPASSRARLRAS